MKLLKKTSLLAGAAALAALLMAGPAQTQGWDTSEGPLTPDRTWVSRTYPDRPVPYAATYSPRAFMSQEELINSDVYRPRTTYARTPISRSTRLRGMAAIEMAERQRTDELNARQLARTYVASRY